MEKNYRYGWVYKSTNVPKLNKFVFLKSDVLIRFSVFGLTVNLWKPWLC